MATRDAWKMQASIDKAAVIKDIGGYRYYATPGGTLVSVPLPMAERYSEDINNALESLRMERWDENRFKSTMLSFRGRVIRGDLPLSMGRGSRGGQRKVTVTPSSGRHGAGRSEPAPVPRSAAHLP